MASLSSLNSFLPAPTQYVYDREEEERSSKKTSTQIALAQASTAPPYGHRRGWVPRTQADYGDGGAYPEIHVAQFPLLMGKQKTTSNALAKTLDAEGKVRYDIIARQGHGKDKVVHSKFQDLVAKPMEDEEKLQKPSEEDVAETTERTRLALEKLVQGKISAAMPVKAADKKQPAQYIRYTPAQQGVAFNSGSKQRIIRMVEVQKDPMEPPKFKTNKKIPRGPPSPPAPVMHSPNRKVTVKEQAEWKIPPCISNWKNAKGYTIPLDKRLAADGRGLQGVHINENFAKLASSLYIADRKAREAVETRATIEKQLASKKKEEKEAKLRELAYEARNERAGIMSGADRADAEYREREEIRRERNKERQRDRNLARAGTDKRNRIQRERERDISEKIALGMPNTGRGQDADGGFDSRLFNREKGMSSGFKDDEAYDVYDQPWRKDQSIGSNIYRPGRNVEKEYEGVDDLVKNNRFVPDKEFSGTDRSQKREGPVQFEKDDDIFGLTFLEFLEDAKRGEKRSSDDRRHDRKRDRKE